MTLQKIYLALSLVQTLPRRRRDKLLAKFRARIRLKVKEEVSLFASMPSKLFPRFSQRLHRSRGKRQAKPLEKYFDDLDKDTFKYSGTSMTTKI